MTEFDFVGVILFFIFLEFLLLLLFVWFLIVFSFEAGSHYIALTGHRLGV